MKLKQLALALSLGLVLAACGGGGGGGGNDTGGGGSSDPGAENPPPSGGGGGDTTADINVVRGIVSDFATGQRLKGVTVTAGGRSVTTNAKGEYAIEVPADKRMVLAFSAEGYAPGYEQVTVSNDAAALMIALKKQGELQSYKSNETKTIYQRTQVGPYAVIFKPNTLDTDDINLRVAVTPLDPTKESSVLPGDLITPDAVLNPLTFAEFTILDSAGNHVNLKPGAEAVVELPIPMELRGRPEYALGETIHCYSYNPVTGQWEDFVVGVITLSSVDGVTPVVRASVKHFSWYGAAPQAEECEWFSGRVVSAVDGKPLPGARVEAFPGSVTRTAANGEFNVITTKGANPKIVATRTYTDTDGSVSGTPGAKIIEFGKLDTDYLPIAPLVRCEDALASMQANTVPAQVRAVDPTNLEIKIGPVGELNYLVTAMLMDHMVTVMLDSAIPGEEPGEVGEPVSGAKITLLDTVTGNSWDVPQVVLGGEAIPGYYMLTDFNAVPGTRYLLQVDADNNGTIDGSGSVVAVGKLSWVNPTQGATLPRSNFIASWNDTGALIDGYAATYLVQIMGRSELDITRIAQYLGSGRSFQVKQVVNPELDLPPGEYGAIIYAFNGPAVAESDDFDLVNNISGPTVSGSFNSIQTASITSFTLE